MSSAGKRVVSDAVRQAIKQSVGLSKALYQAQPHVVSMPPLKDISGAPCPGTRERRLRLLVSSALFSAALDHHAALVLLLQNDMRSSAFALLRSIFDAVWRGAWASYVAPDDRLEAFSTGRYDPSPDAAIRQLEDKHGILPVLSKIKRQGWSSMSAFVHGGALQVQRWVGDGIIEPQHSDPEVLEVLHVADRLAFAACALFLDAAGLNNEELAAVGEKYLRDPE